MKKLKYVFILVGLVNINQIISRNRAKEIPPIYLEVSEEIIQEYLLDTLEEKNKNEHYAENKRKAYVLRRIKTFLVVCKQYVDLQCILLKEYVSHAFEALKNI